MQQLFEMPDSIIEFMKDKEVKAKEKIIEKINLGQKRRKCESQETEEGEAFVLNKRDLKQDEKI